MKKIVNLLGTGVQEAKQTKQTSKQSSPLTITVSIEKRSCLIRSKKKKKLKKKKEKKD